MTITIIGIGLIGGSLTIALKENGFAERIIGCDKSSANIDKAIRRRLIDEALPLEEAIRQSDIIIAATPVDTMVQMLPGILDQVDRQVAGIGLSQCLKQCGPVRRQRCRGGPGNALERKIGEGQGGIRDADGASSHGFQEFKNVDRSSIFRSKLNAIRGLSKKGKGVRPEPTRQAVA